MTSKYHQPLFLKYRPQTLADVLGQDSVKETLINAIKNQKLVHAYMLTGPRGSGKTSTARIIAKSLNCTGRAESPTTEPCGTCESCESITNSSSIDVAEMDAASHGGVDDARLLIERVNLASVAGKYKIYIIDEVHMLTTSAFNALLKTIEEPPENVIFILATTELDKVPKTIASRCQQLRFKPITIQDAIKRLNHVTKEENINITDAALKLIAEHSGGAMRDALSLLDQLSVFSSTDSSIDEEKILEILGAVPAQDLDTIALSIIKRDALTLVSKLDELIIKGKDPLSISQELSAYLLALLEALNGHNAEKLSNLVTEAKALNIEAYELVQIIDSLNDLEYRLKQSTQSKNILKAWLVKICYRADILVVKDLLSRVEKLEGGITSGSAAQASPNKPIKIPVTNFTPNPKFTAQETPTKPTSTEATNVQAKVSSTALDFLDYLSPGSKGMCVSSQAQLSSIKDAQAILQMPVKFKFLKDKLEARKEEIISALQQSSGQDVKALVIEIVDALPEITNPTAVSSTPTNSSLEASPTERPSLVTSSNGSKLDEVMQAGIGIFGGKEIN